MAQNENISLSLANKIDVLNRSQSLDARYGVYDEESDALGAMLAYGADGRQVAVYTDKVNGKTVVKVYNEVLHQLEPLDPEVYELIAEGAGVTLLDNEDGTFSLISSDSTVLSTIDKSSLIDNTDGTFTFNNTGQPEDDVILDFNASSLPYNNTTSQLSATDVQDAIDEVVSNVASGAGIELIDNENGTFSIVSEDETVLATIDKANLTDNEDGTYTFNNTGDPSGDILLDFNANAIPFDDTTTQLGVSNTQLAIEKTNERIDNLGTMSNESASDYTKTEDLADVALSNDYNDLDNKPTPLTNEDLTIFIDENNVIWSNISDHTEEFTANGTDRNFVSDVDFASIGAVYINGVKIKRDDYLVISESEIEIKETVTLLENDFVEIFGSIFVIEPTI